MQNFFNKDFAKKKIDEVLENLIQYVDVFRVTRVRAPDIIDGAIKILWSLDLSKINFFCRPSNPVIDQKISEKI